MVDLDDRLLRDLARLRERSSPPVGAEQRVRAALDAAIGPGPGGGDDGGSASGGHAGAGLGGTGKSSLAIKLLVATAAAAGVGLFIELGVKRDRPAPDTAAPPVTVSATNHAQAPPSTEQPQPEPEPILVTPGTQPQGPAPRPSEPDEDLLTAEVVLLDRARTTDDLAARLELLEQHRTRFEHGHLAAERESLRISTLCELDQLDRARAAAEKFLLAHPRSPLRLRMRSACPKLDILAE
jgi:hypothetical protein